MTSRTHDQLVTLFNQRRLTAALAARHGQLWQRLAKVIENRWKEVQLRVVACGSDPVDLAFDGSDLNLCILDPSRPYGPAGPVEAVDGSSEWACIDGKPAWYDVDTLADLFMEWEHSDTQPPGTPAWDMLLGSIRANADARVPLVTLTARTKGVVQEDVKVTIVVNDCAGWMSDLLVRDYIALQEAAFGLLYCALKTFFENAGLVGPHAFSGHTIRLMLIALLQLGGYLPDLTDPLLILQLGVSDPKTVYHSDVGQNDGKAKWVVDWVRPSKTYERNKRYEERVHDNGDGTTVKYFISPGFGAQDPPGLHDWDYCEWVSEKDFLGQGGDIWPPNRVGLHRVPPPGTQDDAGDVLAACFQHLWPYVRSDLESNGGESGPCCGRSCEHEPILAINRNGAIKAVDEAPDQWAGDAVIIQDPVSLATNVAGNLRDPAVIERLRFEVQRARSIAIAGKDWDLRELLDNGSRQDSPRPGATGCGGSCAHTEAGSPPPGVHL